MGDRGRMLGYGAVWASPLRSCSRERTQTNAGRRANRYDQGVFGGVIVTPSFLELMGITGEATLQSTVTAIYDVGCFLGAISTIWIGEKFGRKNTIGTYDRLVFKARYPV